jgi:ELWxxDGT repeat protein
MGKKLLFSLVDGMLSRGFSLRDQLFILVFLCFSSMASAQIQLLKDIYKAEVGYYNEYSSLTNAGGVFYYVANNELWKSDGTTAGTVLVKSFTSARNLAVVGTTLYLTADDGVTGPELWKSNGTAAGTVMVKDIYAGATGSNPMNITNVNGTVYFSARNATNGVELWKSNGTAAGTVLVKDILKVAGSSNPGYLRNHNGTLLFVANDGQNGFELWRSNGTDAGTIMVKNIRTAYKASSLPQDLVYINGLTMFSAIDDTGGRELWKTDGTTAGTVRIKDINAGATGSDVDNLTNVNGTLFFSANDGIHGDELWKSNGTAAGTVLVEDLHPGAAGSNNYYPDYGPQIGNFKNINGILYFTGAVEYTNYIYKSDGTEAGTVRITEIPWSDCCGGNLELNPDFEYVNGYVYFMNFEWRDDEYYYVAGLYKMPYNGTTPELVKRIENTYSGGNIAFNNLLIFVNRLTTTSGFQLLKSDGTAAGTVAIKDNASYNGGQVAHMMTHGSYTYMRVASGANPGYQEVWRTNGTPEGTIKLGLGVSGRPWLGAGSYVYWVSYDGAGKWQLWRSAGTTTSTILLKTGTSDNYPPERMINVSGRLYYSTQDGQLWRSDGTVAGTRMLYDFFQIKQLYSGSGRAYVVTNPDGGASTELWRADATGAFRVTTLRSNVPDKIAAHYPSVTLGTVTYFVTHDNTHGNEVWRTNGTASGTYMVQDLSPNDGQDQGSEPWRVEYGIHNLVVHNNQVYLSADDETFANYLWKFNGTNFVKVAETGQAVYMKSLNGLLFSVEMGYPYGTSDITVSDGTMVEVVGTINTYEYNLDIATVGNIFYVASVWQDLLYRSDGTVCGTYKMPTGGLTQIGPIEGLGTSLIHSGFTQTIGQEPYVYRNVNSYGTPSCTSAARVSSAETNSVMTAYPNPYTQEFSLRVEGGEDELIDVAVFTGSGFPVESFRGLKANTDYEHIGANWPKGMYVVQVSKGGVTTVHRVIKK